MAAVAHTQFLPTLAAVVSLEEAVAHLDSSAVTGHIDLLPSVGEEEVHPFEADRIDLQPHSKVVVVAAAAAAEAASYYSAASHIAV